MSHSQYVTGLLSTFPAPLKQIKHSENLEIITTMSRLQSNKLSIINLSFSKVSSFTALNQVYIFQNNNRFSVKLLVILKRLILKYFGIGTLPQPTSLLVQLYHQNKQGRYVTAEYE